MTSFLKLFILTGILLPLLAFGAKLSEDGFFSGRISKINRDISVVRIKVDFDNVKYINVKDKIEFWDEKNSTLKCKGYVLGRTSDYLLLRLPDITYCERSLLFTTGAYFKFFSEDLKNNVSMGREVVSILLKKRMAVQGQLEARNKELTVHMERVNAINARYQTLREKLDQEWQKEIHGLDEDRTFSLRSYKDLERRRDEIDQKLEQYKLKDENLTLDRWSLDSNLYFKK
ncbi:MAG: hypothetical protein K2Q18_03115 [Bdellovibrionales bacterium]|nr:hypothetical protein [Bdellovibrionales bacterium]